MSNYRRFIPEDKTVFIGIDLHQRSWHVTTLVEDQVVFSSNIPPEAEAFFKFRINCLWLPKVGDHE